MHPNRFIVVVGLLAYAACNRGAQITVRNESATEVQDVRVEGRCFAETIGNLRSGARKSVHAKPCGESSIRIKLSVRGAAHETSGLGYIEASSSHAVTLVIGSDFSVRESAR